MTNPAPPLTPEEQEEAKCLADRILEQIEAWDKPDGDDVPLFPPHVAEAARRRIVAGLS